ncbi:MAG: NAD(P)/FAD-dependent oxidoreductase [Bacteroidota bacterium]
MHYDVIIVGGGLAGLTASIYLAKAGFKVAVIEKKSYPHHKVCGEYISNEVRPILQQLELDVRALGAVDIRTFCWSTPKGRQLKAKLPLGGFGISRYTLDHELAKIARNHHVDFLKASVTDIVYHKDQFEVIMQGRRLQAKIVLGAFGKRRILDKRLDRPFIDQKTPWTGVKGHYEYPDFPEHMVALHCFQGGYAGLSKTEGGAVNFCYLVHQSSFKPHGNLAVFHKNVVAQNPHLKQFLAKAKPLFPKPISISQISFAPKAPVDNHILMCGDSAGLIHPLCGNGMAMAIHGGKLVADCIVAYGIGPKADRYQLETAYTEKWQQSFQRRLWYGRQIQKLLLSPWLVDTFWPLLPKSERIVSRLIAQTHGKPILV